MEHGRLPNGLRKVLLIDNLDRRSALHVTGNGTLREALADIFGDGAKAAEATGSWLVAAHWQEITHLTAICGDEIEHFTHPSKANQ